MFRDDFVPHTRNLERVDPRCAPLDYIMGGPRPMRLERVMSNNLRVMSNNFAFGGINTSLILGRI